MAAKKGSGDKEVASSREKSAIPGRGKKYGAGKPTSSAVFGRKRKPKK